MSTESTARRLALRRKAGEVADLAPADKPDRILVALSNRDKMPQLLNLALTLRTPQTAAPLLALNVVLEGEPSARQAGADLLLQAERAAAAANVRIQTYSRWSVNVVSGISHTIKENAVSDLVVGLHQKTKLMDSFYGKLATDLLAAVDRQVLIYRAAMPLNTVRRLQVLVPPKAEFEPGFGGWMDRLAILASQISCGIDTYGHPDTLAAMRQYWERKEAQLVKSGVWREYVSWPDLLPLAHDSRPDWLTVFICARRGSLSHHNYLERLPDQLERDYSARSILLLFPMQPATDAAGTAAIRAGVPLKVR